MTQQHEVSLESRHGQQAGTSSKDVDTSLLHRLDIIQLELTNQCNLKCVHCYTESSPHTGDTDVLRQADYQRLMREARDLGASRVQFLGGEPTLNRYLVKLTEYGMALGFETMEIHSNLIHVSPELVDYAARTGVQFATTFHSSDEQREDAFTASKGSFRRKVKNLMTIMERGIPVRAGIIIKDQPTEDVLATFNFLNGLGLTAIEADRVRDFGRARGEGHDAQLAELCGNCWKGSIAIAADGNAYACPFARDWPVGHISENSLERILRGQALSNIRHQVFEQVFTIGEPPPLQERLLNCSSCGPCGPCGPCAPGGQCGPCGPCGPTNPSGLRM